MPQHIASTGRVLAVIAQPDGLSPLVQTLEQEGHAVFVCAAVDAVDTATALLPDLIVLDTPFPGIVGLPVLTALLAHPATRTIPVIFLTAGDDQQRLLNAFEVGAVACLRKPYEHNELLAQVRVHLHLKLTRDRLAQLARAHEDLLNLVAHDLKNPLSSVLFACEMLALPDANRERTPRYLQIIDDSAREALGYIRNCLQGRLQQLDATTSHPCTHLDDVVRWLAARYELQLEASGLHLQLALPEEAIACVTIDRQLLRQVGENLVSNALKYARSGGPLELRVRRGRPGTWQLVANDRGPGVGKEHQPSLFQAFQHPGGRAAVTDQSSGLGLALSRQLVTAAGGHLWYEDRKRGGARFVVELPEAACTHCHH